MTEPSSDPTTDQPDADARAGYQSVLLNVPPITDRLREHAKRNPGQWTYAIDPALDPAGDVPVEGVMGGWQVDEHGDIDETFRPNRKYRPSPLAQKWPTPTDPLDEVSQWAASGWALPGQVADEVKRATLYVETGPEDAFVIGVRPDGNDQINLYSDPAHAAEGVDLRQTTVEEILGFTDDMALLVINEGSVGSFVLSADYLVDDAPDDGAPGDAAPEEADPEETR